MEQQQLRDLLETLHKELEQVGSVDEKTADVLTSLKDDIGKLVREGDQDDEGRENMVERMNEAIGHFEEEHPKLSMMIQHVLDSLAQMGL
jgi:cytochrome c-type biogenesis protein CcmH/NrfF